MAELRIGRTVIYKLTHPEKYRYSGFIKDLIEEAPAIIVKVHNATKVNLQVFMDTPNNGVMYKQDVIEGPGEGEWSDMPAQDDVKFDATLFKKK